jgi:Periplasmic protease
MNNFKKLNIILTTILIILATQSSSAQKLRLINPGFENSDTLMSVWIKKKNMRTEVKGIIDASTSYKGKHALKLQLDMKDERGGYMQGKAINVSKADRQIHAEATVKTQPGTNADMYVHLYSKGKRNGEVVLTPAYTQNTTWKTFFTRDLLPAGTDSILFNLVVIGSGSAWFDNVEVTFTNGKKTPPLKVKKVIDRALYWAKNNYRFADSVNWKVIERQVLFMAHDARNEDDYYPSIRALVSGVKDPHGHVLTAEQVKQGKEENVTNPEYKPILPYAEMLENGYAYLHVPRCHTDHPKLRKEYAEALLKQIRTLDSMYTLKGWLVDLRDNNGGFCDPMMAALSPVYGPGFMCGTLHLSKAEKGLRDSFSITADGTYPFFTIVPYWPKRNLPIAVLSGPGTGSSGEIILIGFKGHPRAKVFGESSAGVPTGPAPYLLPDGGYFALSESERFDRAGVSYGSRINPDVIVLNPNNDRELATDPVIAAAKKWLDEKRK